MMADHTAVGGNTNQWTGGCHNGLLPAGV
jgi:hypothetical protein